MTLFAYEVTFLIQKLTILFNQVTFSTYKVTLFAYNVIMILQKENSSFTN